MNKKQTWQEIVLELTRAKLKLEELQEKELSEKLDEICKIATLKALQSEKE